MDGGIPKNSKKKRVSFAMKNNLVWNFRNPLPPLSLRLPASVTPRGSALKKGVPPGPIRKMKTKTTTTTTKNKKVNTKAKALKKAQKLRKEKKKLKKSQSPFTLSSLFCGGGWFFHGEKTK